MANTYDIEVLKEALRQEQLNLAAAVTEAEKFDALCKLTKRRANEYRKRVSALRAAITVLEC